MERRTPLLIIGAGPFGLAMAAQAQRLGFEYVLAGKPMSFWKAHMPTGMHLRSAGDWHLDPANEYTIERYLETLGLTRAEVEPLSLECYLGYADWLQRQLRLAPLQLEVESLRYDPAAECFHAAMSDGTTIVAESVVLALGFKDFAHVPEDVATLMPGGRFAHTCDLVDFGTLAGRRCLIIGGRQSAFEWAALLHEAGAASVDIVHRHDRPRFAEADWSWVPPLVSRFETEPGWYRVLPADEQKAIGQRVWAEGRLKVEPWLEPRLQSETIRIRPRTRVHSAIVQPSGEIAVTLDSGDVLTVDQIVLATGYKADLARVPLLARGNLLPSIAIQNGSPVLDDTLQTSVPGLFITSLLAAQACGAFFAFTVAARTSARLIGKGLSAREPGTSRVDKALRAD